MAMNLVANEIYEFRNTTWFENLLIGLQTLFIHPFVPLLKTSFDLDCLLARKPYCSSLVSACNQPILRVPTEPRVAVTAFDIIQLIACSLLLGCLIVKDLGDIIFVWVDKRVLNNSPRLSIVDLTATKN